MNIIWSPQERQRIFMQRKETEALYGGAAGGGKSDCAIAEALRQVHIPHYRGLILRKTYPQLSEMVDRSREIYSPSFPEARYNEQKHCWTFPSGAKIYFGAMQHTKDRTNYQGKRYDFIDFDELTHFTWDEYSYLFSRNRPNGQGTRCYIRAQANPGGIGHGWVKERFITPAPPMTPIYDDVKIVFPDGSSQTRRRSRVFVPSSVFDNKILMQNDPDYITRLAALPENEKRALLYGDWDSFSGQVFTEWRNNPDGYITRKNTHVIEPFTIPNSWKIYRGFDFGYSRPFSVGWYALDHDNRLYRIRELYGCTGTPNEGVRWEPAEIACRIKEIEREDINLKGRYINGIADPSIFDESRGESVAAMMERSGVYFEKADNTRIAGKMQLHNRLAFDDKGIPMLYIFSTCKHFIRTVPALVYSEIDVEDIDTATEDHIYDEVRYIAMENPINPPPKAPLLQIYDPLETADYEQYNFYRFG
ncbi:MAG: Terminase-like family protein [Ruminococcaceae bacterium]|nr:Terminase-like family protein [Oscillospiraceae bacterium]